MCHSCRLGWVKKITVYEQRERQGVGSTLLRRARIEAPGYRWITTGHMSHAKGFWRLMAERSGYGYECAPRCAHMEAAQQHVRERRRDDPG